MIQSKATRSSQRSLPPICTSPGLLLLAFHLSGMQALWECWVPWYQRQPPMNPLLLPVSHFSRKAELLARLVAHCFSVAPQVVRPGQLAAAPSPMPLGTELPRLALVV